MTRKQELQQTISRLVGKAYDAGQQAARDGKSRHHPNNPHQHNPMLAHVFCIGHMDAVAAMHLDPIAAMQLSPRHEADARAILATTGAS